jgi:transposase
MAHVLRQPPHTLVASVFAHESIYVGVDVGKSEHVAGFVSNTLLQRHERFEGCPVLKFANTREGFRQLIDRIMDFVAIEQCFVLLEKTGHYHKALVDYLLELDISVYIMHVQKRPRSLLKSDKRDALGLANHLYNQLEKGIQVADRTQLARRALPPTDAAARLKGSVGHRHELVHESTRRKNKLIALCDQIFPEFTQVFSDPNSPTALTIRDQFPTAEAIATATLDELCAAKGPKRPSRIDMARLQGLATQTIGVKDPGRLAALVFEQEQLVQELRLLHAHLDQIDDQITHILEHAREGRILLSIPGIGAYSAAAILAAIGNVDNFTNAAALKSYFGWAPKVTQSGTTVNTATLTRGGERTMKEVMYLVAIRSVREHGQWTDLYQRLVQRKCDYDEKQRAFRGKMKVIGRIAGQITAMIYAFLKADAELLANTPAGVTPPEPMLYDPAVHQLHRTGQYRSSKPAAPVERITLLPKR